MIKVKQNLRYSKVLCLNLFSGNLILAEQTLASYGHCPLDITLVSVLIFIKNI